MSALPFESTVLRTLNPNSKGSITFWGNFQGHADLGYSGATAQVQTPHIDGFAWDGIILNRHYSDPLCTPTRSSFMTGKYAFQVGKGSHDTEIHLKPSMSARYDSSSKKVEAATERAYHIFRSHISNLASIRSY